MAAGAIDAMIYLKPSRQMLAFLLGVPHPILFILGCACPATGRWLLSIFSKAVCEGRCNLANIKFAADAGIDTSIFSDAPELLPGKRITDV